MLGITTSALRKWVEEDESFRLQFNEAMGAAVDSLEDEAIRRAYSGVEKKVFYKDEQIDTVKEYSDRLLTMLLKGKRREVYGDHSTMDLTGKFSHMSDEALEEFIRRGVESAAIGGSQ